MPFELGLAVAFAEVDSVRDSWFVFETKRHRLSKSLSDLGGTDPYIHKGTIEGVMREIGNAFVRQSSAGRYSVTEMMKTYLVVRLQVKAIKRQTGTQNLFEARAFQLLCAAARAASRSA